MSATSSAHPGHQQHKAHPAHAGHEDAVAVRLGAWARRVVDAPGDQSLLPAEVATSVRRRVLDIVGISLAASSLPTSAAVRRYAAAQGGRPEATAIGLPGALPAPLAALVNGTLAHSLDYDDTHLPSILHPSASIVPAALAAAEAVGADGDGLVAAIAVGLEVCVRVGMAGFDVATNRNEWFERGQHATSICGTVGGAVAAAALLGLDAAGIADAIGVACSMAGGVIEGNRTGGTVKRVHCGWAAHAALSAAGLVAAGITGPPTAIEGRFGLLQAFVGEAGAAAAPGILAGLGEADRWEVPLIAYKPYPANHYTHAGIDAALALAAAGLHPGDIAAIHLGVPTPIVRTIGEPIEAKRRPATAYQAQFSGPYTVASALLAGAGHPGAGSGLGLGLADFTDALATDPARRALMALVTVGPDAECDAAYPHQLPAVVTITTTDGRTLVERVKAGRGGPERPLSDADLRTKYLDNATTVLPSDRALALADRIDRLGRPGGPSATELLAHLQET